MVLRDAPRLSFRNHEDVSASQIDIQYLSFGCEFNGNSDAALNSEEDR